MGLASDSTEAITEKSQTAASPLLGKRPDPYNPMERLEQQIFWYDKNSISAQFKFKTLKLMQIITSAMIPIASIFDNVGLDKAPAFLGLVLLVMEGIQQLNQYQQAWTTYRSTCEALKHEKYTYLSGAGPYSRANDPEALLADRIEGLISQEHAKWVTTVNSSKPEKE